MSKRHRRRKNKGGNMLIETKNGAEKYTEMDAFDDLYGYQYGMGTGKITGAVTVPNCKHWRDSVKIGEYEVWASAYRDMPKEATELRAKPHPDLGVYLSMSWHEALTGMMSVGIPCPIKWDWPFITVEWGDYSLPDSWVLNQLLTFVVGKIKSGQRIEIGCMGGHGRTGTLLAMLQVEIGGMTAKAAIDTIRRDYCDEAIEGYAQEESIYELADEEAPERPVIKTPVSMSSSLIPGCATCDHNEWMHKRGIEQFGVKRCAYMKWKDDPKDKWLCSCTEWKAPAPVTLVPGKVKVTESKVEDRDDYNSGANPDVATPGDYEEAIFHIDTFGLDLCSCGDPRSDHAPNKLLGGLCTGCLCESFLLAKAVD